MYEGYAMLIMANMPIAQTGRVLRFNEKSLTKILGYWVDKAIDGRSLADVKNIAIDETSFKKGHEYVSIVIDAMKRAVIDVEPGKDKSVVQSFAQKLKEKGGDCSIIGTVTSDMSAAFLSASKESFCTVFDRCPNLGELNSEKNLRIA